MNRSRALAAVVAVCLAGTAQATTIAAGSDHSIAIKDDGSVWTWGDNSDGELGNGTSGPGTGSVVPVQVSGLTGIVAVAAGENFSVALDDSGNVWTWGDDAAGQLGDGTAGAGRTTPYQVTSISGVSMIAAGQAFVLVRKSDNTVWAWGGNASGQLGDDSTTSSASPVQVKDTPGTGYLTNVLAIAAGSQHALAVTAAGTAYAWGDNTAGQIGIGNTTTPQKLPKQVLGVGGSGTLANVASVAGAQASSFALLSDGTVFSWGANTNGVLGDGTTTARTTPVQVVSAGGSGTLSGIEAISAGASHALAQKSDGSAWTWGTGSNGQRGDNSTTATQASPVQVKDTAGTGYLASVGAIAGGGSHSLAVTSDGHAWGWGLNTSGQLGDNSTTQRNTPVQVDGTDFTSRVKTPSFSPAGGTYAAAQSVTLSTATSGATIRHTEGASPADPTPSDPSGSSVAVTESTTVKARAWASGLAPSQVAQATYTLKVPTPVIAPSTGSYGAAQTVTITGGADTRYTTNGTDPTPGSTLYSGSFGVSTGTTVKARTFQSGWVESDVATAVLSFNYGTLAAPTLSPAPGTYFGARSVTLTSGGATIRYTLDGSEPDGASTLYSGAILVDATLTLKAKAFHPDWTASATASGTYTILSGDLAAGDYHSAAVDGSGQLWTWGHNGQGQLGDGTTTQRAVPTLITSLTGAKAVAAGEYHTLVLKADGTLWAFGHNAYGQLGDATTTQRNAPVQVKGVGGTGYLTGVVAIAAGAYHSLAIDGSGTLYAFGVNSSGQLGDGTTTSRNTPVVVGSLSNVVAIAAGQTHSVAAKTNGTVYAWGANGSGQLGTGNTTPTTTPVQVGSLTGIVAVSTGDQASLALASSGVLYGWGSNSYGQVGDGTTTQRLSPVAVQVITNGRTLASGQLHSLASGSSGVLWGWGYNAYGQVGDGTTTSRSLPTALSGPTGVVRVRAGALHSLALTETGEVWVWGTNGYKQLGDGTTLQRNAPVKLAEAGMLWRVASPVLSPAPGNYTATQNVVVTDATPGATLYYTTNGVEPTTSDATVASGGTVAVSQTLTLKVKGFKSGMAPSETTSGLYTLTVATPTLSPGGATYSTPQNVTVSCSVAGATIRYTTNGVDPTESDASIASGGTIPVDATKTLKARAYKTGWTTSAVVSASYLMKVATPTLTPPGGGYGSVQAITIATTTPGANLHYTTDGVDPLETDTPIVSGTNLLLNWSLTLKVRGYRAGWTTSDIVSGTYRLSLGTIAAPTFNPAPGSYAGAQTVALASTTPGVVIKYTTDGTEPGGSSRTYSAPFPVASTSTVKARAFRADWTPSATSSGAYTITSGAVAAPTFSVGGGSYVTAQTVTMSSTTADATIRYTTDGDDPTASDPVVPGGGLLVDRAMIVKARAFKAGLPDSGITRADYLLTGAVAGGYYHSLVLKADGTVLASGVNGNGQLGDGTTTQRSTFAGSVITDARGIAAGAYHSVILRADGSVWAAGSNSYGQLGDATTTQRTSWVQVKGVGGSGTLAGIVAIAAGTYSSYAVRGSDGAVFAWGANGYGQLGNGSTTGSSTPVQVSGLSGVTSVEAGESQAVALKADGTLYAWGLNNWGQLGDGTYTQRTTPVAVATLFGVSRIATASLSSFAIRSDGLTHGRLWAWGQNNHGQLGDGTNVQKTLPLAGLDAVVAIGGGQSQLIVARRDGSLWGQGYDSDCTLGDGACTTRRVPVPIFGLTDTLALDGGLSFSLALRADGALFAWGNNSNSQLGDGTTTPRTRPVAISNVSVASNGWLLTDSDDDGLTAAAEYRYGTDPLDPDSNDNGVLDGLEVELGQEAASADSDGDGLTNTAEALAGTDPSDADSDNDGVLDGADTWPLDPTRSSPTLDPNDHTPPTITLQEPPGATPLP